MSPRIAAFSLLLCSNIFMTVAWYGHLKFRSLPLWQVVLASWGLAFFEYVLQVPANRIGYEVFSASQLKIMQEAITLVVFFGFSRYVLQETADWRTLVSFSLIFAAVAVAFIK